MTTSARKPTRQTAPLMSGHSQPDAPADARMPDMVTAIFDVLIESNPELAQTRLEDEAAVRHRLAGMRGTVLVKPDSDTTAIRVLSLFNGRNPREVARKLGISRASVYRYLKQAGRRQ